MSGLNLGLRFFVFEPDGTMRGVSNQSFNRMVSRQGAVPQFSGQRLRDVEVIVKLQDKRSVGIVKMHFGYWILDSSGRFDDDNRIRLQRAAMNLRTESLDPRRQNVVDLGRLRKAKQVIAGSKWTPTEQEMAQIIGAIWPECRAPGARKPTFIQISMGSTAAD